MGICHSLPAVADDEVEIPEDIWFEILSRLPNNALLRFRLVSRYHQSLVDRPDFLRTRSDLSIKTSSTCFILSTMICGIHDYYLVCIDLATARPNVRRLTSPLKGRDYPAHLVGGCGGILCLVHELESHRHGIMFWNPLTSRHRSVFNDHVMPRSKVNFRYYFGRDAATDDFKVLKISNNKLEEHYVCEIYSSRKDSWKCIGGINDDIDGWLSLFLDPSDRFKDVFVEGYNSVYMIATKCPNKRYVIVAFDFATEKFSLVPIPFWIEFGSLIPSLALSSFGGLLCFVYRDSQKNYGIWTRHKHGNGWSWSRTLQHLNLDATLKEIVPLEHVLNINTGRELIVFSCNRHPGLLACYASNKNKNYKYKDIPLPKPRMKGCASFSSIPVTYEPSLRPP